VHSQEEKEVFNFLLLLKFTSDRVLHHCYPFLSWEKIAMTLSTLLEALSTIGYGDAATDNSRVRVERMMVTYLASVLFMNSFVICIYFTRIFIIVKGSIRSRYSERQYRPPSASQSHSFHILFSIAPLVKIKCDFKNSLTSIRCSNSQQKKKIPFTYSLLHLIFI
jgi:hypothetical protein